MSSVSSDAGCAGRNQVPNRLAVLLNIYNYIYKYMYVFVYIYIYNMYGNYQPRLDIRTRSCSDEDQRTYFRGHRCYYLSSASTIWSSWVSLWHIVMYMYDYISLCETSALGYCTMCGLYVYVSLVITSHYFASVALSVSVGVCLHGLSLVGHAGLRDLSGHD